MDLGTDCFLMLLIFLTHEFEEIIRFRPWVLAHQHDPEYASDPIIRQKHAYLSTETVAVIIAVMCSVVAALLGLAICLNSFELLLDVLYANAAHLVFFHLVLAALRRQWLPGTITALLMTVASFFLGRAIFNTQAIVMSQVNLAGLLVGVLLLVTLGLLNRAAPAIQRRLDQHH